MPSQAYRIGSSAVTRPLGGTTTSIYDAAHRLTTREFGGSGQTPLRLDLTYTATDLIATETRYTDLAGTNKIGSTTMTLAGMPLPRPASVASWSLSALATPAMSFVKL